MINTTPGFDGLFCPVETSTLNTKFHPTNPFLSVLKLHVAMVLSCTERAIRGTIQDGKVMHHSSLKRTLTGVWGYLHRSSWLYLSVNSLVCRSTISKGGGVLTPSREKQSCQTNKHTNKPTCKQASTQQAKVRVPKKPGQQQQQQQQSQVNTSQDMRGIAREKNKTESGLDNKLSNLTVNTDSYGGRSRV